MIDFGAPIPLGQWMPDAQDLNFPNLERAQNVESVGTVYKSFAPLSAGSLSVPGDFVRGLGYSIYGGQLARYAATGDGIFESVSGNFSARSASTAPQVDFLQYDDFEIACLSSSLPMYKTIGSASNFATIGAAPAATRIGKIGQFVFLGNLTASHAVRWSGVDDPLSWPTPSSATAIAQQSGQQFLDANLGEVTGFAGGDQWGLVFQVSGVTRVTFAGPPVNFNFDKVSHQIGCAYPRSIVQVAGITYFISNAGICKTDGVTVVNIGEDRVNNFFIENRVGARERVFGGHDQYKNLIYWSICTDSLSTNSTPNLIILYNYLTDRFTYANQICQGFYSTHGNDSGVGNVTSFHEAGTLGGFSDAGVLTAGATLETGDIEFTPGAYTYLDAAKLIVDQTANARIAVFKTRNELTEADFTSSPASTTNAATGFANYRTEARYHRLVWNVLGIFEQAQAMEFNNSGAR